MFYHLQNNNNLMLLKTIQIILMNIQYMDIRRMILILGGATTGLFVFFTGLFCILWIYNH
jgi:hypothetical protein